MTEFQEILNLDIPKSMDQELTEKEHETESESVNSNKGINNDRKKCDFIANTKGGLKTHDTTKHKTIPTRDINDAIDRDKETDVRICKCDFCDIKCKSNLDFFGHIEVIHKDDYI